MDCEAKHILEYHCTLCSLETTSILYHNVLEQRAEKFREDKKLQITNKIHDANSKAY